MMKLEKKVVLVTGASSGIGRATSLLFAKEGAIVIAVARCLERLVELEALSVGLAGKIVARKGDVSDELAMNVLVDSIVAEFGAMDVLVNNAGVMDEMMPAAEVTDELWNWVMSVNLKAPFNLIRKSLPIMISKGSGVIVNVVSLSGLCGSRAGAAYTASKFAVVGLTKNVGFMYALKGIRCNAICPGAVDMEISSGIKNPSVFGISRVRTGMGVNPRQGSAEEIAKAAFFLASDDSSFVNGATLTVDGGWSAY
jgi:NAD(P)-dependent dehydrogenase (short-subunit alcohol dehydrogenase family)